VLYVGYFVIRALSDLDGFLTRENAEEFLVGPVLTLALIPLLLGTASLSRREQRNFPERSTARSTCLGRTPTPSPSPSRWGLVVGEAPRIRLRPDGDHIQ
jgi:hypothetical protein